MKGDDSAAVPGPERNSMFRRRRNETVRVSDLHIRRGVERLNGFRPKSVTELLAKLGAEFSIRTVINQKPERYAALDPETLKATGGDAFQPMPPRKARP